MRLEAFWDTVFWTLHAREMAESFLKLFEPKLKKKGNDQMVSLIRQLDEVTRVAGDVERIRVCCQTWVSELRLMLHEAEDYVDDFMIKVYGQTRWDQKQSIAEFGSGLENVNPPPVEQSQLQPEHHFCMAMHGHLPMHHPKAKHHPLNSSSFTFNICFFF